MSLKKSCFPDGCEFSSVVPAFKNLGESFIAKNYRHVRLCSVVSKVLEKIANNRFTDQLEKGGF